jgi:hypothetical protein
MPLRLRAMSHLAKRIAALALACTQIALSGCTEEGGQATRKLIRTKHAPRVAQIVIDDIVAHEKGLAVGADRIAAGFVRVQGQQQETEMRQALEILRSPKRGVRELIISPMSFLAAVGMDGKVICRNGDDDKLKGQDFGKQFAPVARALAGEVSYGLAEFPSLEKGGKPSVSLLVAAPAHYQGKVVGALVAGIQLWRLSQRLSRQLQMELSGKSGVVIWVYVYQGDRLHHHGTPPGLDALIPDPAGRAAGLAQSPGGFTGRAQQLAYWYGYGVRPLRVLGDDVGVAIVQMDPR